MQPPLLHGTLALVRDPGSPLGVRFAAIGTGPTPPADATFVEAAADLPDAALTLRLFGSARERQGYAAALSETGGNTFSWIEGPDVPGAPSLLLVARWDRTRTPGTGIDEAVALVGETSGIPGFESRRLAAAKAEAETAERNRIEGAWRRETAWVRADPEMILSGVSEGGIDYASLRSGATCRIEREAGGVRIAFDLRHYRYPADTPGWREAIEAVGLRMLPDGRPATHPAEPDAALPARVDVLAGRLEAAAQRIADLSHATREVDGLLADRNVMRALEGLSHGNLILQSIPGSPAAQLSLKPGSRRQVSGTVLSRLYQAALAAPVWMPPGEGPWRACPGIYAVTPLGLALARGDRQAAIEAVPPKRGRHGRWQPPSNHAQGYGTPEEALRAWGEGLPQEERERLAAVALDEVRDGRGLPRRSDPESWLVPVAGLASGVLRLDADGEALCPQPEPGQPSAAGP